MLCRVTFGLILMATLIVQAGCGRGQARDGAGEYRTVSTEPLRDTAAARRENDKGLQYLAEGKTDKAIDAFTLALSADVDFGPAHNNLGKAYYVQKDWYRAAWEFEYAGKCMPKHAEPRNNLGLVREQAGDLDLAVEHYREAVSLAPDTVEYQANLARALIRRGDRTDEVRTLLQRIVETDTRPDWLIWAKSQLDRMGVGS